MPLTITNTLVNGNVVDAPQLNTNFGDVKDALDGTDNVDVTIKNNHATAPPLTINETGAADIFKAQKNGSDIVTIENNGQIKSVVVTGTPPIAVDSTDVCPNLNAAKVGSIDPSNIAKLDTHKVYFAIPFFIADPSTETLNAWNFPFIPKPTGSNVTLSRIKVAWTAGSRTAGQSVTFSIFIDGVNTASVSLDNTNNGSFFFYENNFADDSTWGNVSIQVTARTGSPTERNVTVIVEGYQSLAT